MSKTDQKGPKISKMCQVYAKKLYYTLIMTFLNENFAMLNKFKNEHMIIYTILALVITKGQKRV